MAAAVGVGADIKSLLTEWFMYAHRLLAHTCRGGLAKLPYMVAWGKARSVLIRTLPGHRLLQPL